MLLATHGAPVSAQTASFQGLGDLPGGVYHSEAFGVSADGSVVVGVANYNFIAGGTGTWEAFRWTAGVMSGLGDLPGGMMQSRASAVSADGSVIVGTGQSGLVREAFRWTASTGFVGLGALPGGSESQAFGISNDGSVIVGTIYFTGGIQAFRWTAPTGMLGLGSHAVLPGGSILSEAYGISPDGSTIVGYGRTSYSPWVIVALRWVPPAGPETLGDLPGGITDAAATGASAGGQVIVGRGRPSSADEAFRWTSSTGMLGMGFAPGGYIGSRGAKVSADGNVIVGTAKLPPFGWDGAFVWDRASGMRSLQSILEATGVISVNGWWLFDALDVSADGTVIVGRGDNPAGDIEAWVAIIPRFCYVNCDASTITPVLNVNDFVCFSNRFVAGDTYTNCDASTNAPLLTVNDFICFTNRYAAGCS